MKRRAKKKSRRTRRARKKVASRQKCRQPNFEQPLACPGRDVVHSPRREAPSIFA